MKRVIVLVALVAIVAGLLLSGVANTSTFLADTRSADSELTSNLTEANNSSASATITTRMYTLADNEIR